MIKKLFQVILVPLILVLFLASITSNPVFAQQPEIPQEELMKAKVVSILEEGEKHIEGLENYSNAYQKVQLKLLDGNDAGKEIVLEHGGQFSVNSSQKVKKGQVVVLTKIATPDGTEQYQIIDKYRLNELLYIGLLFLILVLLLSRWKGIGSFLGMVLSLLVIVKFIVPQILDGKDPLFISIVGAIFILITSIYLAHGFSKQTTVAVVATSLTLIVTGFLSVAFVNITNLSGLASEDALSLQFGSTAAINFKGLLLGGMIIGFLGVLDDITTGLAATVFELKKVNPRMRLNELIKSSLNIGREHISSLVNTLVLAYAGASLPLFLFIVLNPQGYPLWFIVNSEFIAEEVVRTLAGSIGLLCAVPVTAIIAAWVVTSKSSK